METTDILKCVKCGGEMKEENADMMKCADCGATINKNKEIETEDATKI